MRLKPKDVGKRKRVKFDLPSRETQLIEMTITVEGKPDTLTLFRPRHFNYLTSELERLRQTQGEAIKAFIEGHKEPHDKNRPNTHSPKNI